MKENIGDKILAARTARGWTQMTLAHMAEVSLDTVSGLESGRKENVSIDKLKKIGGILEIKFEV